MMQFHEPLNNLTAAMGRHGHGNKELSLP